MRQHTALGKPFGRIPTNFAKNTDNSNDPRILKFVHCCKISLFMAIIRLAKMVFTLSFVCSEQIIRHQDNLEKQYTALRDMADERRRHLDNIYHMFQLRREVEDLEQWIAERDIKASSQEMGQDLDHVTVSTH